MCNMKKIELKPILNKSNNQINFNLKRLSLPEEYRDRLPKLKGIKVELNDFLFEDE